MLQLILNSMDQLSDDISREIFKYLDTKSQYNFFLMDKHNSQVFKRNISHNSIKYIADELGLSKSDLHDNFFANYIREDSLTLLKEIIDILEPFKTFKCKNNIFSYSFSVKYLIIKRKSLDECKNHIIQYKNNSRITKLMLKRKKEYFSSKYFNKSLYKQARSVYLILI